MATEADTQAPVCETINEELGESNKIPNIALTREEKTQQADKPNEPCTVEGENFFKTASTTGKDHSEVKSDANTEKPEIRADGSCKEHEGLDKESEKLLETEISTGKNPNGNESAVDSKVGDENAYLCRAESLESEKITSVVLNENLHVISENSNKTKGYMEEQSTNGNLHAVTSDVTEDKIEDGDATKAVPCEDIKTSDSSYEKETSSIEEQRATALSAHPQDGKTDEKAVEVNEEIYENVSTIDSNEKTEENSSIQVGGPQKKNEEHLEKDIVESSSGNEDLLESEKKSSTSMNKDLDRRATNVNEHGNTSDITEVENFDAVINIQNEVLENSSRTGSNEETEEKGTTEADHSELPEKESEKPSSTEPLEREASYSESTVAQNEDAESTKAGPCEIETSTRSMLPEIESNTEKPEDSSNVASEDITKSNSSYEIETSSIEEQRATAHPEDGKTDDKAALDAKEVKEDINENVQPIVPNEEMKENSLIQVDGSQKKDENVAKVGEKPSMTKESSQEIETSSPEEQSAQSQIILDQKIEDKALDAAETKDINVESTAMHEAEISNESIRKVGSPIDDKNIDSALLKKENFQDAAEDHKTSVSHEDIKSTCSIDDPSLTANPQSIMSGKTTDAIETKEIHHENVATEIPHEHTEEILAGQVDCSHTENYEHLEKESEVLPHEPKDLIKDVLSEKERNTVTALVKEEGQEEKHTNYLQEAHDDTKASKSTHVTDISSTEEEISTAEPQEISNDEKQETTTADAAKTHGLQDIETITLDGDDKNGSLIKEDGSEVTHEARFVEEQSLKAHLLEEEKHEEVVVKEEVPTESLQVSDEDTKAASAFVQNREISSLEEQSLTTESHGVMGDNEDKTNEATIIEKESQNATTTTSYEDSEDNSQKQVDVSQLEQIKHYEKVSENKPLTEASARDTVENALEEQTTNVNLHAITSDVTEDKNEDGEATKSGPCENEISPRSTLPEIESNIEKPEDSSNVASEDIKTSDSNYEIETHSNEEQRATEHPQDGNTNDKSVEIKEEIYENVSTIDSIEKTEENSSIQVGGPQKENEEHSEKAIEESSLGNEDLVESEEKSSTSMNKDLDRRATNVNEHGNTSHITENSSRIGSNEETEEKGTTEADCSELQEKESEKPSLLEPLEREASDNEFIVMHEAQIEDGEPLERKAELHETETSKRSVLTEIESKIEKQEDSLNVASEDIKTSDSSYEIETSSFEEKSATAHPQDGKTDDKAALDADEVKEEIHENVQPIVSNEEMEENSLIQVDGSQKKDENLEKVSEKPSMIKDCGQEIETSLSEEQSAHSQIILDQKTDDKVLDAAETKEETLEVVQNVLTCDSNEKTEEKSMIQEGGTQKTTKEHLEDIEKPSLIKDFIVNTNDNEINVTDDVKPEDVNSTELLENNKASVLGQHTETTCFREDQFLTENPQGTFKTEDETTDAVDTNKETKEHQNVATEIPHEHTEEILARQVDCSHTENDEHLEKESEILPLAEASMEETNDNEFKLHESKDIIKAELLENERNTVTALVEEEAQEEKHTDYIQATHDDTNASESTHVTDISSTEEESLTAGAEPQEISNDNKQETATADAAKTHELQDIETINLDGEDKNDSLIIEDGSEEHSLKEISFGKADDNVSAVTHEAKFLEEQSIKDELLEEEKHEEIESLQVSDDVEVATEDTKSSSSCQTIETSSIKEQIPVADPQEISSNKIEENTIGAAYTEEKTAEDDATKVPNRDNEDNLPKEVYDSLGTSSEEASVGTINDDASINIHEGKFVDEKLTKANLFENEKNIECTSLEKEVVIESLKEADEDIKACATFQDRETASLVDQDQIMDHKITEATKLKEETPDEKDTETNITSGKNEDDSATKVDDLQGTSLTEVSDYESKIMHEPRLVDESFLKADSVGNEINADGASEEHMMISNEHIINVTSSASEPSEQDIDPTYTEKLPTLDTCSTIQTPTSEDPTKSVHSDAQGPNEENKAKSIQEDTLARISEDASESNMLNCDEEGINSNNLNDMSDSSISVALEEVSSSNVASETDSTPYPSQENEDTQKQDEDNLCISAPVQDSSIEKDAELCPEITREMQKIEEAPLPAPDENTVKNTDYEESGVAEDADISFLNDKKVTERENQETECKQESIFLDETVEEIKETASIPVANDVVPKSFIETSEIDHSTANLQTRETHNDDDRETKIDKDKEEEACELIISELDSSSPAPNITEARDMDGANRSIADLEAKIDDEAPEILQAAPSATESQEVEVIKVGEALASVSEREREDYIHAKIGTEEKTDSNEVGFAPEESKAGHEVKNQVHGDVQSCGMISEADENLETAAGIKSETVMVEDIIEAKETAKTNFSSQKINEEDDVKNDHTDSYTDITETHLENQAKQEENTNTREIFEVIKNANEIDKVSEVLEEADDNAVEEPQEYMEDNREVKTVDATDLKAETFKEKAPESVAVEIPSTKDSNVNKEDVIVSNERVANVITSVSEPSEQDIDKIDAEKITEIDDRSTKIPTNEDLVETSPTESSVKADGQVPDEEIKKEESEQQDMSVGISEDVPKSNLRDIPETDSTLNPSPESAAEDGLCVSAPVQDLSTEKIEKDVESYLARAIDSETTQEIQKLEEATESFLNDEKHTEREHDETECKQEKALLDETVEETKEPASVVVTVANDVIPKSFTDCSSAEGWLTINRGDARTHDDEEEEAKLDKNKEDGAGEPKISDFSSPATDIIEASGKYESKIGYEAQEIIQTAPSATETRELENINVSASISQRERDGKQSNEFGFSTEESKTGYEVKNQVLENVQSCGVISIVEDNLEAEIKSETVIVEDMIEPKEIKEEDEYVKNDHLGSCEEEAITEGQIKDQPKQEEKANSEETFEVITKENVMEKVPKVSEEEDGKAVEEKLRTNESIDSSLHQKGQGNSVDNVTTISGTEKVRELDHSHIISTGTRDSEEEVNKSSVKFLEDEDKSTDIIENEIAKEEGLLNQISNTSKKDAVSKDQPKRPDEYMIYEAPPAQTVPKIIEDGEDKKVNADTIMIQHQEEYKKSKHESDPLEKQDKNDEICLSGELQTKDEVNLMLSAEKDEDEAKKEGTLSKPTEDKDEITYTESEKVNVPSHSEDTAQSDKKQESERQIDSLPILPVAKCSDIETAEKDLPTEYSGLGADHNNDINPENSVGNKKPTAIESELPKNSVLETDEATCEREVKPSQGATTPTSQTEKTDVAEHEDKETGEEKDESSEERQLELCSEAPVMVDIGDADAKVAHKKSHNILSGVGSKVKHSIAKVKKAITGKSSHPKPPATIIQSHLPPSPK